MAGAAIEKHGAYSRRVQRLYKDKRTGPGRELARVMNQLIEDLGGASSLTQAQHLLLDLVRSKLIILMQLGAYLDKQTNIIGGDGKPLEVLNSLHLNYSKALRQDLETLTGLDRRKAKPGKSLAAWIQENAK